MKALIAALLLALPLLGFGQDAMVLCIEDQAASPYTYPTKDGTMQVLLKMAAKQAGQALTFSISPWKRCIESVRSGALNGIVNAGYTPFHAEYAAFPMSANGKPNTAESLATMHVMAYHMKNSDASWDGSKFLNVKQPVLMPAGFATISDQLKSLNVPYDDNTKEPLRNLYKMIGGQGQIVLGFDIEMNSLIAGHKDIEGKVEMLPAKFMTADFYVAFSKGYYASHKSQVDALWAAIGKTRKSKEYLDAIKDIK
ncbi:polar amino acid transport system substrate-binding protein [Oxalobacteraceae bacterium GrIS 1.11]